MFYVKSYKQKRDKVMKKNIAILLLVSIISSNVKSNISNINNTKSNISNTEKTEKFFFSQKQKKKSWNFMVYITSNNNLFPFSELNIEQMMKVGSNKNINIIVQQDVYGKAESKRIYIEKNQQKMIERVTRPPESISGTPESLYSFARWAINKYPAKHQALILWDHGSGIIDPNIWRETLKLNPSALYKINTETGFFELNRKLINKRGICFNEIFEVYLTNQTLKETLRKISTNLLNNKKIDIVGADACNMAMLEVGSQIKDYVKYMVGSEETEPGTGWNYNKVLTPFKTKALTPKEFSINIVDAYQKHYQYTHQDFTQSAINLKKLSRLEENISETSRKLIELLNGEKKATIISKLKSLRRNRTKTTKFANPSYIDMHHFYISISNLTKKMAQEQSNISIKEKLEEIKILANEGSNIINEIVLKKTFCASLPFAQGISFYFPTTKIHASYKETDFAINNNWHQFLKKYLTS